MALEPSDVLLESVFCQLDADTPRSLHDLKGDPRANLLAIRLLFRQGRITGVLLDDPSGAEDQHGPSRATPGPTCWRSACCSARAASPACCWTTPAVPRTSMGR
ncbi:hypothetical protein ACSEUG_21520 [Pseudomonas aeruginosa]